MVMGEDGLARLKDNQTIAGSTLSMNQGLKLLVEEAMVPFECALNACTINPAGFLELKGKRGGLWRAATPIWCCWERNMR